MALRALRGAITVDGDQADEIKARAAQLVSALIERNDLDPDDLVSIFFTATEDLRSVAPAAGVREFGLTDVPLLCATEMPVDGSLERCVRLLLHIETDRPRAELRHVFLRGATVLRPDLSEPGDDATDDLPAGRSPNEATA